MSTTEFWWEFDAKIKVQKELGKKTKKSGAFTEAEWEAARRKFREREDGRTTDGASR